jgi:tRNA threonylcarbamoyladenosine biosynthesis protein TsaB
MLRALALETSGRVGSIALVEDGQVVVEETFPHGLQHAATVLPMIDRLTKSRGWQPNQLDHVYVSVGPGSFTGLRIGVTLAKTLALSVGCKVVAVPTSRVLLLNLPAEAREAIIVLDAKRGQIFTARYTRTPDVDPSDLKMAWTGNEPEHLDTLNAMLNRAGRPVHLIGEGIPYHRAAIPDVPQVIVTDEDAWRARADAVARIGADMAHSGMFADPYKITPIYVRLPEAEEKRLIAEGKLPA